MEIKDRINPPDAVDAVLGKEYTFRGKKIKFSMACFFALEKAGIPISDIDEKPIESAAVVLYVATKPKDTVWSVMQRGVISRAAAEFADTLSPAEFLAGKNVAIEMIGDYLKSVASYSTGDDEKNRQTVAEAS